MIEAIAPASSISPSVRRNPTASSSSWPGVRIVTATSTGRLAGSAGPDRERLLARQAVLADLDLVPAHGDDPGEGGLPRRGFGGTRHARQSTPAILHA